MLDQGAEFVESHGSLYNLISLNTYVVLIELHKRLRPQRLLISSFVSLFLSRLNQSKVRIGAGMSIKFRERSDWHATYMKAIFIRSAHAAALLLLQLFNCNLTQINCCQFRKLSLTIQQNVGGVSADWIRLAQDPVPDLATTCTSLLHRTHYDTQIG